MALRRPRNPSTRRGSESALVIVGLANPGPQYESSRHNVGGDAVRLLAQRLRTKLVLEGRQRCLSSTVSTAQGLVTLAVPMTFMNESGASMPALLRRSSLTDLRRLAVVHDELDLEPGRLQFKMGGGLAGHNGLRSIAAVIGDGEFARLRIGIGKPPTKEQGADWVLRPLVGRHREERTVVVEAAAAALELLCEVGFDEAQQRVNTPSRE